MTTAPAHPAYCQLRVTPRERPIFAIGQVDETMENPVNNIKRSVNRRSFMKSGLLASGAATVGAGLLAKGTLARAQEQGALDKGDEAILRFVAAAELIESDLWVQYAELGGIGDNKPIEVDPNPNPPLNNYQIALSNLDGDGPQYISSNTLD